MKRSPIFLFFLFLAATACAEDGYGLWLRYQQVAGARRLQQYRAQVTGLKAPGQTPTLAAAAGELRTGLKGLLGRPLPDHSGIATGTLLIGTPATAPDLAALSLPELQQTGAEGYLIRTVLKGGKRLTVIAAATEKGVLYGTFHFLRLLQSEQDITELSILEKPRLGLRLLNHWDNLDRTVERGYAGGSIWDWHRLPDYMDPRYLDYARANASIGINGTVLTNVNANATVLTPLYLEKVKALADLFRTYGIRVYLTARFSAPVEIGGLKTADPHDPAVQQWWKEKVKEIYRYVPDFGGFLVKANSEGQPGPQNYGRHHADGANLLADAVAPFGGIVMWRAFVYSQEAEDRFKQAYQEFRPLDGAFRRNVLVQVKNGPVDFQPREPFHPLFGAMPQTPLMMEFQLTQEYLGFATHLVFMPPMFREVLDADTHAKGPGSTVTRVIDGSLNGHPLTGMAGVSNIGADRNWTGHLFGQSNWYALGRLAWNPGLSSAAIADEWTRLTFGNEPRLVDTVKKMMLLSHAALVQYMTPLGLHHIMGYGHHYGPAPWWDQAPRADWNPVYFHRADSAGIGFNRTASGSDALSQYAPAVRQLYADPATCPEAYLLWFHHVSWDRRMRSGRTLWEELCHQYAEGVTKVRWMQQAWNGLKTRLDEGRYEQVRMLLAIQEKEAVWWRNACLAYFSRVSRRPIPAGIEK
ncbi:MAG TPA: alpha-glucuronidase family glycosyl hydrolase, partial [Chitinophagaceae bacterium]|nr:alpha-glucuronidase family glycosyl hydrolase [Chitinophagaceae bacterium]